MDSYAQPDHNLIRKYDVPVPRYTSYPTVPAWNSVGFGIDGWCRAVKHVFSETNSRDGISLYVHLPFCESLCTYCACNTRITKNHAVESPYIDSLLFEWRSYQALMHEAPVIREIHLGGGTPTFFHADSLHRLISGLLNGSQVHPQFSFSFEGHPNSTTREHLSALGGLGFKRVSYGVQDLDEAVQRAIHRIQPFETLREVVAQSREEAYDSISFDLVYGLPFQTAETVRHTINRVLELRPDRIAFYSYAHVPWLRPGQRGYEDADLPGSAEKRVLYETGRGLLISAGYEDVGMDHFALPDDELCKAKNEGRLHRNFMGYTTTQSELLIGLGASAISDAKYAYAQNEKKVEDYKIQISETGWALSKGHQMTQEDLFRRRAILDLSCKGFLNRADYDRLGEFGNLPDLGEFFEDGLLILTEEGIRVSDIGWMCIRNICSSFDRYYEGNDVSRRFSRSI